jgi:NAD(P)-dependent dehydrogenase (short-subunit alcohol dehydrogenase family)
MLATEFALKKLPIRVNCIAPGVYATEMTFREGGVFTEEETNAVGKGLLPVPARRNGT